MKKDGIFIVLEGINGCGKTTLIKKLEKFFQEKGSTVVLTREPGAATPISTRLRKIILEKSEGEIPSTPAEVLLFAADRAEHVNKLIRPALERGEVVISDRYVYSSIVFQGYGRGLPLERIIDINLFAIDGTVPDLVLVVDLPVEVALKRIADRAGLDVFEDENVAFHERTRQGFLAITKKDALPSGVNAPCAILNGELSPEGVFNEACNAIEKLLSL